MNSGFGMIAFFDAMDAADRNRRPARHVDRPARRRAERPVGHPGQVLAGWVRAGLASLAAVLMGRPETFAEAAERLAETSPHLLADVGLQFDPLVGASVAPRAQRGPVRVPPAKAAAVVPFPARGEEPARQDDPAHGYPYGTAIAAE